MTSESKELKKLYKFMRKIKKICPVIYQEPKPERKFKIILSSHTNYDDEGKIVFYERFYE